MSVQVCCDEALLAALQEHSLDSVEGAFDYSGGRDLDKPRLDNRRRTRIELTDGRGLRHVLYLKRYAPEGMLKRIRRAITYGPGRSPAEVEFENILTVRAAGVATMSPVIIGRDDVPPAFQRSYLIVTAVPGDAMERCFEDYAAGAEGDSLERFTKTLAEFVRKFHASGFVHRDLYSSHIFMDASQRRVDLYLIDLARMFRPRLGRFRWLVKDLSALKFSMPDSWTGEFWGEFMKVYLRPQGAGRADAFERAIDKRVRWMNKRHSVGHAVKRK